jgi:hypothetical protein
MRHGGDGGGQGECPLSLFKKGGLEDHIKFSYA